VGSRVVKMANSSLHIQLPHRIGAVCNLRPLPCADVLQSGDSLPDESFQLESWSEGGGNTPIRFPSVVHRDVPWAIPILTR